MTSSKRDIISKTKLEFYNEIKKYHSNLKPSKELEGYASQAIVGEKNYPTPQIHNIQSPNEENSFFKTSDVVKKDYSQIIKLKARNVLAHTNSIHIKKTKQKVIGEINDIYKARKAVDFTSKFDKELTFNKPIINSMSGILGTKNELLRLELNQNAPTSKQIEKYIQEDVKSKESLIELYERKVPESQIINLLSLGNFGIQTNRKIVPTRWTITAYDKTIEEHLCKQVKECRIMSNYQLFYYSDKGNTFLIILAPDAYSFENIEFMPNGWQAVDYVKYDNKLKYKEPNTAGGFYATKVAILEYLRSIKKQASIVCIRLIDNYEIPLGVVFVRESVREAMKKRIDKTSTMEEMKMHILKNHTQFYKEFTSSMTLRELRVQKKLNDFFNPNLD